MQNYIVRVYRAQPDDAGSVSGVIEDTDSGQKESFHNLNDLKTMLGNSIMKGQRGLPNLVTQELDTHEDFAVIG